MQSGRATGTLSRNRCSGLSRREKRDNPPRRFGQGVKGEHGGLVSRVPAQMSERERKTTLLLRLGDQELSKGGGQSDHGKILEKRDEDPITSKGKNVGLIDPGGVFSI